MTFQDSKVAARLPAQDLDRARAFYAERLGLEPADERPGGLLYRVGGGEFALFRSSGRTSGEHTQMGFEVADIETAVAEGAIAHRAVPYRVCDRDSERTHQPARHHGADRERAAVVVGLPLAGRPLQTLI
jgi:catechol 2,3-dioxygenase-like lactoylglutathione lyase family enzyme